MKQAFVLAVAAVALGGCRNLEFPKDAEATNAPPDIDYLSPKDGDRLGLVHPVQLDVRDPSGVASVSLFCSGVPLHTWSAEPFAASVDFSPCPSVGAEPAPGVRSIQLLATATDRLGAATQTPLAILVEVDGSRPGIAFEAPERVVPRGRLDMVVRADRDLQAPPTVTLGGIAARVSHLPALETTSGGFTVFRAVVDEAPAIGADATDGGVVSPEALEDLERDFTVVVEARALNGNAGRAELVVTVSRIAWRRSPPWYMGSSGGVGFRPGEAAGPVATDGGIVVPMQTASTSWVPVVISHDRGQYDPFDRWDLTTDAGLSPAALDAEGRLLLLGWMSGETALLDLGSNAVVAHDDGGIRLTGGFELARLGGRLCEESNTDTSGTGACPGPMEHALTCFGPGGYGRLTADAGFADFSVGVASMATESAGVYYGTGFSQCAFGAGPHVAFVADPATGAATVGPAIAATNNPPSKLVPLHDGTAVVTFQLFNSNTYQTELLLPDGGNGGVFFSKEAQAVLEPYAGAGVEPTSIVAGLGGRLLTLRHQGLDTVFEAWTHQGTTPLSVRLPGLFTTEARTAPVAYGYATDARGGITLLAQQTGSMDPVVLSFDADLRPRFLYRPPDVWSRSRPLELHANPTGSHAYVVDFDLQTVTALAR